MADGRGEGAATRSSNPLLLVCWCGAKAPANVDAGRGFYYKAKQNRARQTNSDYANVGEGASGGDDGGYVVVDLGEFN